jgi:hypothetical protein
MGKKLSSMTWEEVQSEMSIAGNPAKITQLGRDIEDLLLPKLDATNRAEMINAELMLKRLIAEIRILQKRYDQSH